jgi:hypothetical protein
MLAGNGRCLQGAVRIEGKERRDLAETATDQIELRHSRGNLRTGKYDPESWRKGRQRNRRGDQKGCDKQAVLVQSNRDAGGIISGVRRQKHAENGKQHQQDDPDQKSLLHKNHDSTVLGARSRVIFPDGRVFRVEAGKQKVLKRRLVIRSVGVQSRPIFTLIPRMLL